VLQLGFQRVDARLGVLHLFGQHHLVARLERFALHHAGFLEHFVEDAVEFGDIVGLADLFRIAADLLVEVARRGRHLAQAVDKVIIMFLTVSLTSDRLCLSWPCL
jgi:hypothetical protein